MSHTVSRHVREAKAAHKIQTITQWGTHHIFNTVTIQHGLTVPDAIREWRFGF